MRVLDPETSNKCCSSIEQQQELLLYGAQASKRCRLTEQQQEPLLNSVATSVVVLRDNTTNYKLLVFLKLATPVLFCIKQATGTILPGCS